MDIIQFPPARVLEINHYILGASPGHQGPASIALLEGALGRSDGRPSPSIGEAPLLSQVLPVAIEVYPALSALVAAKL